MNERSSADSLFCKGNVKLYFFHFEPHPIQIDLCYSPSIAYVLLVTAGVNLRKEWQLIPQSVNGITGCHPEYIRQPVIPLTDCDTVSTKVWCMLIYVATALMMSNLGETKFTHICYYYTHIHIPFEKTYSSQDVCFLYFVTWFIIWNRTFLHLFMLLWFDHSIMKQSMEMYK